MRRYRSIEEIDRALERNARSEAPDPELERQLEGQRRAMESRRSGAGRRLDNHIKIVIGGMVLETLLATSAQVDLDKLDAYLHQYAHAMRVARRADPLEPAEASAACRDFERRKRERKIERAQAEAEAVELVREEALRIAEAAAAEVSGDPAVAEAAALEAVGPAGAGAVEMSAGDLRQDVDGAIDDGAAAGQEGLAEAAGGEPEPAGAEEPGGGGREDADGAAAGQVLDNGGTLVRGVYIPPVP